MGTRFWNIFMLVSCPRLYRSKFPLNTLKTFFNFNNGSRQISNQVPFRPVVRVNHKTRHEYINNHTLLINNLEKVSLCTHKQYVSDKNNSENQRHEPSINVDEEMLRYDYEEFEEIIEVDDEIDIVQDLPDYMTKRGVTGVFDIEDICKLLEDEKAKDVVCISIPPEYKYCDYFVILTGKSKRHLKAIAEKIKKAFKMKRNQHDAESVNIEGLLAADWLVLDMGNIVVHLFLENVRLKYNLEELWTVGSELDSHCIEEKTSMNQSSKEYKLDQYGDNENDHVNLSINSFSFDKELERIIKLRLSEKFNKENK